MAASTFCATLADATEFKPWYGRIFEIEARGSVLMQQFSRVDTSHGKKKRYETDAFYNLSAATSVWENIAAEVEFEASSTKHCSFGADALRLTGRYLWMNDVIGDPVSLSTGITFSGIFDPVHRNIAAFDHGGVAGLAHIAVGKEWSCEQFWVSRFWGMAAIGIADVGSPWLQADIYWERNWWERHRLELYANSIWGLGGNQLGHIHHFHGYGSISYQAVDAGIRYSYRLCNDALLTVGYGYRVYGKNCPWGANFLLVKICYPFGL